ncbi:MAG: uL15 family ribosomal protein [Candidatus Bathyarchaeia archaeon]|nr:uL15 family ribosomal protein [Candidatus Bathyarchaeota archaeon]
MPHKLRKIRKKRGSRTCGYGRVGQHRKSGSKGERRAGRHKHLWSWVLRYEPDYFGNVGFVSPKSLKRDIRCINLKELEEIAMKIAPKTKRGEKIFIDLEEMGYTKLLGEGKITLPVRVKVPSYTKVALRKIEEAGGEIISAEETEEIEIAK